MGLSECGLPVIQQVFLSQWFLSAFHSFHVESKWVSANVGLLFQPDFPREFASQVLGKISEPALHSVMENELCMYRRGGR